MSKQRPDIPPQPPPGGERRPAPAAAPASASASSEAKPKKAKTRAASPWSWGIYARIAVSLLALFHLVAVFSAPWYIQLRPIIVPALPPGTSPRDPQGREIPLDRLDPQQFPPLRPVLPQFLAESLRHYTNLLYINNGYDFFSPDPAVSHIIRYEAFNAAGEKLAEGKLPDRREHSPRLFYHRHMMLVEQSQDPAMQGRGWEEAIARELLEKHQGDRIRLELVRHHLLTPEQVLAGERLDAPSTYEPLGVMEYRAPPSNPAGEEVPGGQP